MPRASAATVAVRAGFRLRLGRDRELRQLSIDDGQDPPPGQAERLVRRLKPEAVGERDEAVRRLAQVQPRPGLAQPRRVAKMLVDEPAPVLVVVPVLCGQRITGPRDAPE